MLMSSMLTSHLGHPAVFQTVLQLQLVHPRGTQGPDAGRGDGNVRLHDTDEKKH